MRVLCLDCDLGIDEDHFRFSSTVSLYDYDVVFWRPAESLSQYSIYSSTYLGKDSLRENESARLVNDVSRRRAEFKEFVEMGRSLFVILPGDTEVYVDTGQRTYSGTGRNRATTQIVKTFDLMTAVPLTLTRSHGSGLEMVPADSTIASLFKQTSDCWAYRCVIEEGKGIRPLLHIKGTKKAVAALVKLKSGGLIGLLPDLILPFADEDDDEETKGAGALTEGAATPEEGSEESGEGSSEDADPWPGDLLLSWVESLVAEPDSSLPSWTADYRFPTEAERAQRQVEVERQLTAIQQQVDALNAEQAQDERWKILVTGSGASLERRVGAALELIGFEIEEGDPGRTDLRGEYQGNRVVVEVKGVTKSGAEKNAAQLEKWVSDELVEGRAAKGILVVNTWRDLPLANRTGDDFPNQMLNYSGQRGHCLVTGLQLLAMVRAVLADASRKDEVAQLLMSTVGTIEGWNELSTLFAANEVTAEADDAPSVELSEQVETEDAPSVELWEQVGSEDAPSSSAAEIPEEQQGSTRS